MILWNATIGAVRTSSCTYRPVVRTGNLKVAQNNLRDKTATISDEMITKRESRAGTQPTYKVYDIAVDRAVTEHWSIAFGIFIFQKDPYA
jgi:hypothetical protein